MAFDWPKNPDGTNKKLGELTQEQQKAVWAESICRIGAEMNDPSSHFRRGIDAVMAHGDVPKA